MAGNTPTPNKNFLEPTAGDPNWDVPVNANFTAIDQAFGSTFPIAVGTGGTQALTSSTGASTSGVFWYTAQQLTISASGVLTSNVIITFPASIDTAGNMGGAWIVSNNITSNQQTTFTVTLKGVSGTGVTIASGKTATIWTDGTNVYFADTNVNPIGSTAVSATATLNTAIFGTVVYVSGSTYTLTFPTPVGNNGATFQIYLSATAITLSTPAGIFTGASGSGASTVVLTSINSNVYLYTFYSNGTNWYTVQSPVSSNSSGRVPPRFISAANQASPWAWNSDAYDQLEITALANALTINADAGTPVNGQKVIFRIKDNGTARALTWTTGTSKSFEEIGVVLPTTTTASKILYVGCIYNSTAARWDAVAVNTQV